MIPPISMTKQELEALQAFTVQKQQAVTTLMNLQLAGLPVRKIDCRTNQGRWNKQWPGIGSPDLSQGNGSSSTKLDDKLIGIEYRLINRIISSL
jgi:hypothetical protein